MNLAILSGHGGWHVEDLIRAAAELGHAARAVDFRHLACGVEAGPAPLAGFDAAIVRTMPSGSLEQIVFRIRDSGIGIPPDAQSSIFDLFRQLGSAVDRPQGGLGVGLTLVKV